jgi:hypothetical protein
MNMLAMSGVFPLYFAKRSVYDRTAAPTTSLAIWNAA